METIIQAQAEMLIRKPIQDDFRAFIDPEITTKFWFTKSSGKLGSGTKIRWDWEMYGVHTDVIVKEIEQNKRLVIEWDDGSSTVEWLFQDRDENNTLVTIRNFGFKGEQDEIVAQALDSTGGFTLVLCNLKAYLEYNIQLNLIADKAPDAVIDY